MISGAFLGDDRVKWEPLELLIYGSDAGASHGTAAAVALPESTEEVAACVRIAMAWDVSVIARGAGTGLAGSVVPTEPSLIVALTRMNRVEEVDVDGRTAWVGPGVINLELSQQIAHLGVHFAPDPSSQAACTIGGNVGTNAGGPHCLADGTTVAHILGVEMVTADGEVVVLGGGGAGSGRPRSSGRSRRLRGNTRHRHQGCSSNSPTTHPQCARC